MSRRENLIGGGNVNVLIGEAHGRLTIPLDEVWWEVRRKRLRRIAVHNLVPTCGLGKLDDLIGYPEFSGSGFTPAYFAIGTSSTATTSTTTALGTEVFRKAISRRTAPDSGNGVVFYCYVEPSEGNTNNLREVALFTEAADETGTVWNRAVHPLVEKTDSIYVLYEILWALSAS